MNAQRTTNKGRTISAPQALESTPLEMFAPVYRACAQHGVDALAVDEMEVWQVASELGVGMETDSSRPAAAGGPPPPGALSRGRRRRAS